MRPGVRWKGLPAGVRVAGGTQPGLDLEPAAKKPRPFKLTPPTPKERPQQQEITATLNKMIVDGGTFHIANEGMYQFIPDNDLRSRLWMAMKKDGVLPGAPDNIVFWKAAPDQPFPYLGFLEIKREGWTVSGDKRWREGEQPKAQAWLAGLGAPTAIVRSIYEAQDALISWGVKLRYRLEPNASGGYRYIYDDPPLT